MKTHIVFVLDRSGSMARIAGGTIEGFNRFLHEQQGTPNDTLFTLIQFNQRIEFVCEAIPITYVPLLSEQTFDPCGNTALLDAIGIAMESIRTRVLQSDHQTQVIIVILTDGLENCSRRFDRPSIAAHIRLAREQHGWQFLFLGATQEVLEQASAVGIPESSTIPFNGTDDGSASALYSASSTLSDLRRNIRRREKSDDESSGSRDDAPHA